MEQIILRFPHLGQEIFNLLDNNDLEKSREVDKYWNIYIAEQKFYSIRIIKGTIHILRKHVLGVFRPLPPVPRFDYNGA